MKGDLLRAEVVCSQLIPNVSEELATSMKLPSHIKSLGLLTGSIDDVTFIAADEATKAANVEVVYGECLFSALNAPYTGLAGEAIVILGGPNPAEVISGMEAAKRMLGEGAYYINANDEGSSIYMSYCISGVGSYFANSFNIPEGISMAYCIAPPIEAYCGVDAAVKAADVRIVESYFPPLHTSNFAGALMVGTQSACKAACEAFSESVIFVANNAKQV